MYLPRNIDAILLDWTREADRKPLVLRGARQTDEQLTVRMPEGELAYRLLSLPVYLAEKLPALELGAASSARRKRGDSRDNRFDAGAVEEPEPSVDESSGARPGGTRSGRRSGSAQDRASTASPRHASARDAWERAGSER
jgi:hypothetical protein